MCLCLEAIYDTLQKKEFGYFFSAPESCGENEFKGDGLIYLVK